MHEERENVIHVETNSMNLQIQLEQGPKRQTINYKNNGMQTPRVKIMIVLIY